jgi:hypothetical protein
MKEDAIQVLDGLVKLYNPAPHCWNAQESHP